MHSSNLRATLNSSHLDSSLLAHLIDARRFQSTRLYYKKNIEIPFESDQKKKKNHASPTPNSHNTVNDSPKVHLVGPHTLVRHQPGTKSIILQPSDPTVVCTGQFAENTGSLPYNNLGIEVSGRCPDHDLL
jgi:hypothetical protein